MSKISIKGRLSHLDPTVLILLDNGPTNSNSTRNPCSFRLSLTIIQATVELLIHSFFALQVKSGKLRCLLPSPEPLTLTIDTAVTRGKYRILYYIIVRPDGCSGCPLG